MSTSPEQMTEDELLAVAGNAMTKATALPPGSTARAIQWAVYDTYSGELARRGARWLAANRPGRQP